MQIPELARTHLACPELLQHRMLDAWTSAVNTYTRAQLSTAKKIIPALQDVSTAFLDVCGPAECMRAMGDLPAEPLYDIWFAAVLTTGLNLPGTSVNIKSYSPQ